MAGRGCDGPGFPKTFDGLVRGPVQQVVVELEGVEADRVDLRGRLRGVITVCALYAYDCLPAGGPDDGKPRRLRSPETWRHKLLHRPYAYGIVGGETPAYPS